MFLVSLHSRVASIRVSSAFRLFALTTVLAGSIATPAQLAVKQLAGPKLAAPSQLRAASEQEPTRTSSALRPTRGLPARPKPRDGNASVVPAFVWTQAMPATSPQGRYYPAMAYDDATGQVVFFGGANRDSSTLNDTWTYNGTTWTQQNPATSPPARSNSMMTYDTATGQVVLFGGIDSTGNAFGDTWTYDGTTWTQQSPATSPPASSYATMAYDDSTGQVVLFGGYDSHYFILSDTWTYDGTTWTQQSPASSPSARASSTTALDAAGQVVLFGGVDVNGTLLGDTWTYDGTTWTQQDPANSPSARYLSPIAYSATSGQVVLFGGIDSNGNILGDTWTFDATTWTQQAPATSPSARYEPSMAYDAATGEVVLFGGVDSNGNIPTDTWNYGRTAPPFPDTAIGSSTIVTATFTFTSGGSINAPVVLTQGAPNLDFTDAGTGTCTTNGASFVYNAGDSCTVDVNFAPTAPGQRLGAIEISTTNGKVPPPESTNGGQLTTEFISANGTGPQVTFPPGQTPATLGSGFSGPYGVAVDGAGNVYVVDTYNNAVKEIPYSGSGYGTPVTLGSGFNFPVGVAVDGAGNVFVADSGNNAVKMIPYSGSGYGTPATLGSGFSSPFGVAVDGAGNVFVADRNNDAVKKIPYSGGSYGTPVTLASGFNGPLGVAVDGAGNVYVADTDSRAVKEIPYSGGSYGTPVTLGSGFSYPYGVAVDGAGNVYVADTANDAVKEIPYSGGSYGAPAPLGSGFNEPHGVAVDGAGNVYVADSGNSAVKMIDLSTPPTVSFADTTMGNTSATQTLIINNDGYDPAASNPLTFPIPAVGSTNPAVGTEFNVTNSSTCPLLTSSSGSAGTLAAGASCSYVLSYQPVTTGAVAHFLTLTDNSLNVVASQNIPMTGSTGGDGLSVNNVTAPFNDSAVVLSFTIGYGGNVQPTGTPTLSVDGSTDGVGAITCQTKAGHFRCTATYDASCVLPGDHTIAATEPADGNYSEADGTGTLTIQAGANVCPIYRKARKSVNAKWKP